MPIDTHAAGAADEQPSLADHAKDHGRDWAVWWQGSGERGDHIMEVRQGGTGYAREIAFIGPDHHDQAGSLVDAHNEQVRRLREVIGRQAAAKSLLQAELGRIRAVIPASLSYEVPDTAEAVAVTFRQYVKVAAEATALRKAATASPAPGALADLQALSEAAARGPWSVSGVRRRLDESSCVIIDAPSCDVLFALPSGNGAQALEALRDARLAVAAVNYVRTLIASSPAASAPPVDGGDRERIAAIISPGVFNDGPYDPYGPAPEVLKPEIDRQRSLALAKADAILAHPRPAAGAAGLVEALKPFAAVAEHDIGSDEADADLFRPTFRHNSAPAITVGDLRRAAAALARHATPDGEATEQEQALRYAESLTRSLHEKHWKVDAPEWQPLAGDLIGLMTQIDNMTVGLHRVTPQGAGETAGGVHLASRLEAALAEAKARTAEVHQLRSNLANTKAAYEDALATLAAIATAAPEQAGSRGYVRYVKRGKRGQEFDVLGEARGFQLDEYGEPHPHNLTIYRKVGSDHLAWMRPDEFRVHFVPVAARPHSDAEGRS